MQARALINASGPWVSHLLTEQLGRPALKKVRLVKGAHIVVPRLYDHASPYILQHTDGRVVFVIPYEQEFSLIGTTDSDYQGDPAEVAITDAEIDYLCAAVSRYFKRPVTPDQVRFAYAGVRPLYDDATGDVSAVTRDYAFDLDSDGAPLLSVFGGKITTYRKLAEHALEKLQPLLGFERRPWTACAAAARRRHAGRRFRALPRRADGALRLAAAGTRPPLCPRLRHPGPAPAQGCGRRWTISASTWAMDCTRPRSTT